MSRASDRAYEEIRRRILAGALPPGAQLREEELAELCGVSRTPIRDAMHRLEAEMFIQRTDSQRSFVSTWSDEEVDELFTLRTMLEGHAAARAAERVSINALASLQRNVDATALAIAPPSPDVDAFLLLNAGFHGLIIQAAASAQLATMLNRLVVQPIVHQTALRYGADQLGRSLAEHVEIVAAMQEGDGDWARAVMTSHIRRAFHVYRQARPVDTAAATN